MHFLLSGLFVLVPPAPYVCILTFRRALFRNLFCIWSILYALGGPLVTISNNMVTSNKAQQGLAYIFQFPVMISGNTLFCNNTGSLFAFNSQVNFTDNTTFIDNFSPTSTGYAEGGAMTAFQSTINFLGLCSFINNSAEDGGAILATDSKLNICTFLYDSPSDDIAYLIGIVNNTARKRGGGIYLYRSDLVSIANSRTMISGNKAGDEGGGIYAISSSVIVYHKNEAINYYDKHVRFWVYTNEAKRGGGLYMGLNAKLYILQYQYTTISDVDASFFPVIFEANCANYGGAIYVDDETNFGTCESSSSDKYSTATECFMQSIMLYNRDMPLSPDDTGLLIETVVTEFIQNNAIISGSDLFGGLLDRCTVSPFAEVHYVNSSCEKNVTGFSYFTCMTSISASNQEEYRQNTTIINSGPVQLCFCTDGQPDCNHLLPSVHVKKGELFQVELVAVDQVNNVIPDVIVHSFLSGSESSLANGPLNQKTESYYCTTLKFRITSPQSSESLTLYAEGPCKDACLPSSEKCECLFQRVLMPKLFPAKKRKYEFYL